MSTEQAETSLEVLLGKLRAGDAAAATELFFKYEPMLRAVVRRQLSARLRAKFDSADIVQSVWADVLHRFRGANWEFGNAGQLRGFLITATRNRFIDRYRQNRTALQHEQPLTAGLGDGPLASRQPRPSEEAQAHDLWTRMLALCSANHRELLELKRQGLALAEIAQRTGFHESSVRRILYDLARKLAFDGTNDS